MRIVSLASGSKGNAYCVESQGALLLIDCGLSCRELCRRLAAVGFEPTAIVGVLFTHDHSDHVAGLETFHKHYPEAELAATLMTAEAIAHRVGICEEDFYPFEIGQEFQVGSFTIRAFSIPHDAADPVGYLIKADGCTYFHGTAIGTPVDSVGLKLSEANVATVESNHDPVMLHNSQRAESLKQRIRGHGRSGEAFCHVEAPEDLPGPSLERVQHAVSGRTCDAGDAGGDSSYRHLA